MRYISLLILIPIAILCTVLLSSCNKKAKENLQKNNTTNNLSGNLSNVDFYDYDYIVVGSYGGFTGGSKSHRIAADGTIQAIRQMKAQAPTDTLKFYTLSKSDNKQLKKEVKESKIVETTLNDPGNMTFFITLIKNNAEHTVKWGKSKDNLPENIKKLYNILLKHCTKE